MIEVFAAGTAHLPHCPYTYAIARICIHRFGFCRTGGAQGGKREILQSERYGY